MCKCVCVCVCVCVCARARAQERRKGITLSDAFKVESAVWWGGG